MRREALDKILKQYEVEIAYLFGSQQEAGIAFLDGETRGIEKGSDLDIGVAFKGLPKKTFEVYGALYADLSVFFEPFTIDLIFLQETSPLFQYEAVCGACAFCNDENFLDVYEEMVMKTASDLAFKKVEFERDFLEAIKDGYFEITRR